EDPGGADARAVLFFTRNHVARTHGAALVTPAGADADAAQGRAREAPRVRRILELRLRLRGRVVGTKSDIGAAGIWVDYFSGSHPVARLPDRLEFQKRAHDLVAKHDRQQLTLGLSVAVLAGERAAVFLTRETGGILCERAILVDALRAIEIEVDARVDAALAEMAIEPGVV